MATSFPALKPISADLSPAAFPVKRYTSVNGKTTTRIYGSKGSDHPFNLEFLLPGAQAALILAAWYAAKGGYDALLLPDEIYASLTTEERATIPTYLKWKFLDQPRLSYGGAPGWSRVSVQLNGEIA